MTKNPSKPLSNSYLPLTSLLVISLIGVFVLATFVDQTLFPYLFGSIVVILSYLIVLRNKTIKTQASLFLKQQDCRERINLVEAAIANERKAINSFREKIVNSSELKNLTEKLSMSLHLEDTSRVLTTEVNHLLGRNDTTIILYLFHSKTGELGISASQKGLMRVNLKSKQGDQYDQWVVKTMKPLLIENLKNDYRFDTDKSDVDEQRPIKSVMAVPMLIGNKAMGILRLDNPKTNYFNIEDLRFLMTVGDLGAIAIENAKLYQRVEQLAIRDGLTGLYLRRYFMDRLAHEITRHVKNSAPLSFIMLDIDYFKKYNDNFGHIAGDIVLKKVGELLSSHFSSAGMLVCRYGGEEFAVLLPDCAKEQAVELTEDFRKKVEKESILLRREKTHITISAGVSCFGDDATSKSDLINHADQALYQAKESGRNRVNSA